MTTAVEVGGVVAVVVATVVGEVVLAVADTNVVLPTTVVETGVAGLPPCGRVRHAAHTPPHSTNKAAVADSHRIGRCLGVGMTRFSVSVVIQWGQKRAFDANVAPQYGQVFILTITPIFLNRYQAVSSKDYPNRFIVSYTTSAVEFFQCKRGGFPIRSVVLIGAATPIKAVFIIQAVAITCQQR